jgi:3-hydroxybutyryl-CoA dehydrogenase
MPEIRTVGVLGCGLMGSGIAEIAAKAGFGRRSARSTTNVRRQGAAAIEKSLGRAVDKGKLDAGAR